MSCARSGRSRISHGQVIEVLVANRLSAPAPMVRVGDWAAAWAVEEVFGVTRACSTMTGSPARWTRSPRTWTRSPASARRRSRVRDRCGAAALGHDLDLHVRRLPGPGRGTAPRSGHPKDRRADLKQIQTGLAVAGDGGIPLFHRAYDGGAGEVAQVVGAMNALKKIAGPRRFLLVGDSKLISYRTWPRWMPRRRFRRPAGRPQVPAGLFAALAGAAAEVDYATGRDAGKPAGRPEHLPGPRTAMDLPGPRKNDPVHLRRILVHSTATPPAQAKAGAKLARAAEDLDKLVAPPGPGSTPPAKRRRPGQAIAAKRRAAEYLRTTITTAPAGKPVWPGTSTRTRSTPRPPPTAGTRC